MSDFAKEETSLKDIFLTVKDFFNYLKTYWLIFIFIVAIVFSIKFLSFYFAPNTYLAKLSFVIENTNNSQSGPNLNGVSSMADQFGVNISGNAGSAIDYISGKNLNTYFNSYSIVSKVLNAKLGSNTNYTFAQKYAEVYMYDVKKFNSEDELNHTIYENIIKNEVKIEPLKGSSFLEIKVEMRDTQLAIFFPKILLNEAIKEYTKLKIGKQTKILEKTQKTADSIAYLLNNKIINSYKKQELLFNNNPAILTNRVSFDEATSDKQLLLTLYGQINTQLNTLKMTINQETPYVQILDDIQKPLSSSKNSIIYGIITAFFFGVIISLVIFGVLFFLKK